MKIIQPSIEYMGPVPTDYVGALRHIERCGRLCYKSEKNITETSAEPFVKRLIKAGHLAMVEHSNFVARTPLGRNDSIGKLLGLAGKFLMITADDAFIYVGGNLTAWWQSISRERSSFGMAFEEVYGCLFNPGIQYGKSRKWRQCPHDEIPKELHRYSVKFICDRSVSHELVRHRPCSFAQESTRYVNYGGKEMEFIEPWWWANDQEENRNEFCNTCYYAERRYGRLLENGQKPQAARAVLPNALKTEIIVTADAAEWRHIKKLRTAKDAHPDMQRVMNMVPWEDLT